MLQEIDAGAYRTADRRAGEGLPLDEEGADLCRLYDRAYEVSPAGGSRAAVEAHALRYQVYCLERGFEDPAGSPGGLERDRFDERSVHCLLRHRSTGIPVGTARLILSDAAAPRASWPIQQVCRDPRLFDARVVPPEHSAEVSRFCLSLEARRRIQAARGGEPEADPGLAAHLDSLALLGLIRGLLVESLHRGLTHWTLVVEAGLLRLLGRFGLDFTRLGPPVEYHGRRQPCFRDLAGLFEGMRRRRPELWAVVTADGSLAPDPAPDPARSAPAR